MSSEPLFKANLNSDFTIYVSSAIFEGGTTRWFSCVLFEGNEVVEISEHHSKLSDALAKVHEMTMWVFADSAYVTDDVDKEAFKPFE